MMIEGSHVARAALIAACGLCLGWAGPLQAQSLFSTTSSRSQTERLARTSGTVTATQVRAGTAFFVDESGDMLTAGHVAAGCARIVVAKEGQAFSARVIALSSQVDLALMKLPKTLGLSAVFPRTVTVGVNDMLFAADYENLANMTAHGGALANATVALNDTEPGYLAINSNVTFGASGAPVLDSRGLVQGVISRRVTSGHGWLSNPVQHNGPVMLPLNAEGHGLAVDVTEAKAFLAANHIAFDEDDRPQIAASGSRANRAASISARVFCLQN